MNKFKTVILFFGAICTSINLVHASTPSLLSVDEPTQAASNAAKSAVQAATEQLHKGEVNKVLRAALERVVEASINVLNEFGQSQYAKQKEQEWMASFSIKTHSVLDLGDHEPLSQWLSDFYKNIEAKVDAKWIRLFSLGDIKVFNYGIPVAASPRSNPANGQDWGIQEYGLHFVPVASASVYWISSQACSLAIPLPWSLGCGVAARLPRYAMEHFAGKPLSDHVYNLFN